MIKKQLLELINAYKNDEDVLMYIEELLKSFIEYANFTATLEATLTIKKILNPNDYIEYFIKNDNLKSLKHDIAIASANKINRLCEKKGLKKLVMNTCDRDKVARFIGDFVNTLYLHGINKGEDVLYEMSENNIVIRQENIINDIKKL